MNSSKVSLPSNSMIKFYYYFSHFSFSLTWLLTPLLLYVIISQSKEMKSYKWFILNHSFWCLGFETIIGIFKPVILAPAFSGYSMTFKAGYYQTAIITVIGFVCSTNYGISLSVSTCSRYLTTFPSFLSTLLTKKSIVGIGGIIFGICSICITTVAITTMRIDIKALREDAEKYDPFFETFNETSMLHFPIEKNSSVILLSFVTCSTVILGGFIVIAFFIFIVKTSASTMTVSKMQHSLIISSIAQILLSLIFFMIPNTIGVALIAFQIPHSSDAICAIFCIISLHSLMEFIATLYFVLPYRKFIKKLFFVIFKLKNSSAENQVIPSMSTQMSSSEILGIGRIE